MSEDSRGSALVTGAAGFIGSHVAERLLDDGWRVCGIDNYDPFYSRGIKEANLDAMLEHPGFRFAEGDVRDEEFLSAIFEHEGFDAVIHLAARPGVRPSIEAPAEYYDCNVTGTLTLLEVMRRFRVNALVFASSSSVYGRSNGEGAFSEEQAADRPLSPYAATKRAGELLCHTYSHLHDIRCYCLRLFTVYGPRQRPDLAVHKFTRAICTGAEVPVYGDGSARRDYTYVDDVVEAIRAALNRIVDEPDPSYAVVNIGATRTVTVKKLVEVIADALHALPQVQHLPPQPGDMPITWADISRARDLLEYEPKVPIEEGVRRFVAWYLARQEPVLPAEGRETAHTGSD